MTMVNRATWKVLKKRSNADYFSKTETRRSSFSSMIALTTRYGADCCQSFRCEMLADKGTFRQPSIGPNSPKGPASWSITFVTKSAGITWIYFPGTYGALPMLSRSPKDSSRLKQVITQSISNGATAKPVRPPKLVFHRVGRAGGEEEYPVS